MTDIKQLLDGIRLSQCGWENSEDIMMFNGTPIGSTISQNVEIDRWWPSLKEELSLLLAPAIEAAVAAAVQAEQQRCRREEVEPLKVHPDVDKLRLLADWFDGEQQREPDRWKEFGVQEDLRWWADRIEQAIAAVRAAQEKAGKEQP